MGVALECRVLNSENGYFFNNGKLIALREGLTSGSALSFFATDHLGSINATLWADGSTRVDSRYLPFGKERWAVNVTPTGTRYTAQRLDEKLGLYDYNARYYDPEIGRFLAADTLIPDYTDPQSFNRFAYVHNNPLRYIDPTGHRETEYDENENSTERDPESDWEDNFTEYVPQNKSTHLPIATTPDIIIEWVYAPLGFLPSPNNLAISKAIGFLSAATDLGEMFFATLATLGVKVLPDAVAIGDIILSAISSYGGGETGLITLPGMPEMLVLGQDVLFTIIEFLGPIAAKIFLAFIGTLVIPGVGTFTGSSIGDGIDVFTSAFNFSYDFMRLFEVIPTWYGLGFYSNSAGQLTIAFIVYNP